MFPSIGACGWSGLGYVGGSGAWINGAPSGSWGLLVAAHELGHNFGVLHAHSYDCGTLTIAPSGCTRGEYGDRFDVMGNSRAGHFNAQFKDSFGWLPAGSVRVHGGGTATYTIGALEATGQSAYAVRIPTTMSDRTYWIEWRNRAGFDAGEPVAVANGGLVRLRAERRRRDGSPRHDARDDDLRRLRARRRPRLHRPRAYPHHHDALEDGDVAHGAGGLRHAAARDVVSHPDAVPRLRHAKRGTGPTGDPRSLRAPRARSSSEADAACPPRRSRSPATSRSLSPTAAGSLRVVPGGTGPTGTTTVSFSAGKTRANNVVVGLGASGDLLVDGLASGSAHAIFDVVGWFE